MRYSASEWLEIIRLFEQSSLAVRRTLKQIGVSQVAPQWSNQIDTAVAAPQFGRDSIACRFA